VLEVKFSFRISAGSRNEKKRAGVFAPVSERDKTEHCSLLQNAALMFSRGAVLRVHCVVSQLLKIKMYHFYANQNSKATELKIITNNLSLRIIAPFSLTRFRINSVSENLPHIW
jgi:hypothetical protein